MSYHSVYRQLAKSEANTVRVTSVVVVDVAIVVDIPKVGSPVDVRRTQPVPISLTATCIIAHNPRPI
jgi:hypothetical protein